MKNGPRTHFPVTCFYALDSHGETAAMALAPKAPARCAAGSLCLETGIT